MPVKAQDDFSFETLVERIYEEPKNLSNLSVIDEFQKKVNVEGFIFYQKVINAIQHHPLFKSNEHHNHNIKVMALEHCWHEMIYIKIDEFLKDNREATLFTLRENNKSYENLINRFNKKIEVATAFLSKKEFIIQEIERIKTIFLAPLVAAVNGDFKVVREFSFSKFKQYAFDLLSRGEDYKIDKILFNALIEYNNYCDPSYTYKSNTVFQPIVVHSIYTSLSEGVGYLMYDKFLKEKLSEIDMVPTNIYEPKVRNKVVPKKERKNPSAKMRALLQKEIKSICPFCSSEDVDHFQIHHIDENPSNNKLENLLMLCPTCHSKITKGDITKDFVILKKRTLDFRKGNNDFSEIFFSKELFQKKLNQLISQFDSIYYTELKEHWNSYSLISDCVFLNDVTNQFVSKSIEFGLLPFISDLVSKHLYYDRDAKYLYNQPHIYMHNSEDQGYNLPVYYHIRFIGILYATAIRNKVDIDVIALHNKNMQSIYSNMIKGMIDNLNLNGVDNSQEYPTNYHWLIGEILSITNHWLDNFNENENFVETFSYVDFIPFNIRLCFAELYKGVNNGKLTREFIVNHFYYKVLSGYFSPLLNDVLRQSIEENIISEIPKEFIEPILEFALDEAYAVRTDEFYANKYRVLNNKERKILNRFRSFLINSKKI